MFLVGLAHIKDIFTWCLCCPKEHLLEMWQTFAHVNSLSKKPISENTIVPQDS